jgi:pyruvate dehydrogenase E1 component
VTFPTEVEAPARPGAAELETLEQIQRRVLWLATSMVHHANKVREVSSGVKVGGHQASSASMVTIMTALHLKHLRGEDRVSVKPHAAPILHALNYLTGRLDPSWLTRLREYGGLQSYPSRTKDPDPVDFSTGSVGIGATATIWSALAHRYVEDHFEVAGGGRNIALVGDAELDEGAIWEAIVDPMTPRLGNVMWVVDLNRQSLDRVVPDIAAGRIGAMFHAAGWETITVKYGTRLRTLFERDGGTALQERLDEMGNEEYQYCLRTPTSEVREALAGSGRRRREILEVLSDLDDVGVADVLGDLGGHDIGDLLDAFRQADLATDRPSVVFAYTVKAWGLPSRGHPSNHSALLTQEQWRDLAPVLGADADDPWAAFQPGTAAFELCMDAAARLHRAPVEIPSPVVVPAEMGRERAGTASTQQAFGRFFLDLAREAPDVAARVVTVSPDVASSTNLGGWINRAGIWNTGDRVDWFADDRDRLVRWQESQAGQHIELGIAEVNLVGLLSELGLTWARDGQPLFPVGTLYDPFVARALEPWSFGMYAGGQSILVGTPSGVTLAPEGGAHQSIITPSIGLEQPSCTAWEPAFGADLEWSLLAAIASLGRPGGTSAYFRLTTRPLDQALAAHPTDRIGREQRRRDVLGGGYAIRQSNGKPLVTLVGMGAVMAEVAAAHDQLIRDGIPCDLVCLTSADLMFRALQARQALLPGDSSILDRAFPPERATPMVTVLDGHPHTLGFLAGVHGSPIAMLGVHDFGQVGDVADLYRHFGIDTETVVGAAFDLIDL